MPMHAAGNIPEKSGYMGAETAVYCGWGPISGVRNQGDELCYQGIVSLLGGNGFVDLKDVRNRYDPVIEPWQGDSL